MAEYWKSTPSYWCKFCSTYVRDTAIERKNHEASFKHQNNIQRGLRDIHKNKERETRDQQRAKEEVARLNGLVGGKGGASSKPERILGAQDRSGRSTSAASSGPALDIATQRKLHAEQLVALGVELPEDLKRQVQGIGSWEVLSERVVEPSQTGEESILKDEDGVDDPTAAIKGVRKRQAQNDDDEERQEEGERRKAWGSRFKSYPGKDNSEVGNDLDALLNAVSKPKDTVKKEDAREDVKEEEPADAQIALQQVPDVNEPKSEVKQESEVVAPPIAFKKRKVKR